MERVKHRKTAFKEICLLIFNCIREGITLSIHRIYLFALYVMLSEDHWEGTTSVAPPKEKKNILLK